MVMMSLDRQLRELEAFDARDADILSVYLNTEPRGDGAAGLLRHFREIVGPLLEAAAGERDRRLLEAELEAVRDYLLSMVAPPVGLAVFSCSPCRYFRIVRLPVHAGAAAFWTDHAVIEPLQAAAEKILPEEATETVAAGM